MSDWISGEALRHAFLKQDDNDTTLILKSGSGVTGRLSDLPSPKFMAGEVTVDQYPNGSTVVLRSEIAAVYSYPRQKEPEATQELPS